MAKKPKTEKANKASGPKAPAAGIGHNSGKVIPELVKLVDEILAFDEQKKSIAKAQRDLRNRAKQEFGVLAGPLAHEIRLRKMDKDVRVQFEMGHTDLKTSLGYQPELDFVNGVATNVSQRAQPSEAELNGGDDDEGFDAPADDDDSGDDDRIEREG